jgi:hypothetical protein
MRIDMCDLAGRQSVDELWGMNSTNGMSRQVCQASVKKLFSIIHPISEFEKMI